MKFLGFWLIVAATIFAMSLAVPLLPSNKTGEEGEDVLHFLRVPGRSLLSQHHHGQKKMTCNKCPRVCWMKGSPGKYCCKKKCVDVLTDQRNCGCCDHKCGYSEICCKGKCVDVKTDRKHCGGCNTKCKKGRKCQYGMCNYA